MINCPFCGGTGAADGSSLACPACRGLGTVSDSGPPIDPDAQPTERFAVTGAATQRVIVTWWCGTEHTLYRPPEGNP
jgi:RecJ-like exonuclease